MKLTHHLLRLVVGPAREVTASVRVLTPAGAPCRSPVFRAPALPTPNQLSSELPFSANLRPRLAPRL